VKKKTRKVKKRAKARFTNLFFPIYAPFYRSAKSERELDGAFLPQKRMLKPDVEY